jgi:hypothetical protein
MRKPQMGQGNRSLVKRENASVNRATSAPAIERDDGLRDRPYADDLDRERAPRTFVADRLARSMLEQRLPER